jgi:hypothetical protein
LTASTDNPIHRSHARLLVGAIASTAILALACAVFATAAHADGDPASDVLATQALFLPQDAGIPLAQRSQLAGLLEASASSGYPIRVAIIATKADLGSVTELWRQPQTYARFLGQELSLVYHGPLLVVMPGGYGFDKPDLPQAAGTSPLAGLRNPAGGAGLGAAALMAIERLATTAGHHVTVPPATNTKTPASGGADALPAIALLLGALVITAAWTVSLRARPPRVRRSKVPST